MNKELRLDSRNNPKMFSFPAWIWRGSRNYQASLKILCFLVLGSLLLFGCDDMMKSDHKPADTDVVATVNGENLTVKQIHKGILARKRQFRVGKNKELKPEEMLYLKTESLNELILDTLLQQEAKNNKIAVSPEELDRELAMIKSGYQEGDFAKTLKLQKISLPEWEKSFKNNLLIKKLINQVVNSKVKVEDSQLLEYFEKNEQEFLKGEKIRASHIMLETEEEAQKILKLLKGKKRKFADLAWWGFGIYRAWQNATGA
jgi:parvulin-like peptidyl-prolyl isomerase